MVASREKATLTGTSNPVRYNLSKMIANGARRRRKSIKLKPIRPKAVLVRELEAINVVVMNEWEARAADILKTYRAPGKTGFTDSAEDTGRLLDLIVLTTNQTLIRLTAKVRSWAGKAERLHRASWGEGILSATSIDLSTVLNPYDVSETVEAAIARNVSLIKDINEKTRSRVADAVFRGVQQRTPPREVAKAIREAMDIERKRALRIAADQTQKIYASLNRARHQEAGIDHYIWKHSGKVRPRAHHVARDGVLFKWEATAPDPGRDPVPAGDAPGELPFCGCTSQAVIFGPDRQPL